MAGLARQFWRSRLSTRKSGRDRAAGRANCGWSRVRGGARRPHRRLRGNPGAAGRQCRSRCAVCRAKPLETRRRDDCWSNIAPMSRAGAPRASCTSSATRMRRASIPRAASALREPSRPDSASVSRCSVGFDNPPLNRTTPQSFPDTKGLNARGTGVRALRPAVDQCIRSRAIYERHPRTLRCETRYALDNRGSRETPDRVSAGETHDGDEIRAVTVITDNRLLRCATTDDLAASGRDQRNDAGNVLAKRIVAARAKATDVEANLLVVVREGSGIERRQNSRLAKLSSRSGIPQGVDWIDPEGASGWLDAGE